MTGPLPAISRMKTRDYAMEVAGAFYFITFITIGALIGINLLVVVVTTNLEQMMKAGEQGRQNKIINFSEVSEMGSVCMSADVSIGACVCLCSHIQVPGESKPETQRHHVPP